MGGGGVFRFINKEDRNGFQNNHDCQNHDLNHKIARFYDFTSLKRLESH